MNYGRGGNPISNTFMSLEVHAIFLDTEKSITNGTLNLTKVFSLVIPRVAEHIEFIIRGLD